MKQHQINALALTYQLAAVSCFLCACWCVWVFPAWPERTEPARWRDASRPHTPEQRGHEEGRKEGRIIGREQRRQEERSKAGRKERIRNDILLFCRRCKDWNCPVGGAVSPPPSAPAQVERSSMIVSDWPQFYIFAMKICFKKLF